MIDKNKKNKIIQMVITKKTILILLKPLRSFQTFIFLRSKIILFVTFSIIALLIVIVQYYAFIFTITF